VPPAPEQCAADAGLEYLDLLLTERDVDPCGRIIAESLAITDDMVAAEKVAGARRLPAPGPCH
jgi:hypothetical protein